MRRVIPGWPTARREVLDAAGWCCAKCGKAGRMEVDYKVRIKDGGAELDRRNLQPLCRGCHIAKTKAENTVTPRRLDHRKKTAVLLVELQHEY